MSKEIDVEAMQAIFVAGLSRSGTTLLQGLLCNSQNTIETTRECSYFRSLIEAYNLAQNTGFKYHAEDYFDDNDHFIRFHRQVLGLYFGHVRERFGDLIPVQKEPHILNFFPDILDLMPNAMFVATIRDPRDALTSQIKRLQKQGSKNFNYSNWKNQQFSRYANMHQRIDKMKGRMFYVRYESLCLNPEKVLIDLDKAFQERGYDLNLSATTDDTSWTNKRPSDKPTASELDGKPVQSTSIGNYKNNLDRQVLNAAEQLQPVLKELTGIDWFCADKSEEKIAELPAIIAI